MSVSQETSKHAQILIKEAQHLKLTVYIDSEGYRTIGYGHKIEPNENIPNTITHEQALELLRKDMQIATKRAIKTIGEQGFKKLSAQRQAVLIDLSFNLGQFKFPAMKKQIQNGNFEKAAFEMGQSKYRVQTKSRAYRNMYIMMHNTIINRQQGLEKALHDNLIQKDKNGKFLYSNLVKDPLLKNLLQNNQCKNTDADLAKMIDQVKKMDIGGVSFDIDPVCTRLNGFIIDQKFTKVIQASINDPTNISLLDLVVPLKIMYDPQIPSKNISVSLDPLIPTQPDGPWYKKVFYPLQLSNTDYGQDMIEADYLMKQLSLGVDENNKPYPYPQELKEIGIDVESIFKFVQHKSFQGSRTRLWIVIKDYEVGINERFFEVKKIKMGVELKALECSQNGSLRDCNEDPSPIASRFCSIFTQHYDLLAEHYPILNKMKRLAKASIIAKFMYFKRIPIDLDLINKLYEKQKREYVENLPRLHNKLTKQESNKIIQMSVLGGCSFDISNIQSKLSDLQKQVSQAREIFVKKALNSNSLPLKIVDKQNIGNFNFVCNQKMEIENNKLYPFLFQSLVKCKHCGKAVNMDYYSVQNKQCFEHSSMKCNICSQLVLPGQAYKMNSDKSMVFHDKCFKCTGCGKNVEGPFAKIDGGQYHPECVPKKSVGACEECKKQIYQGQKYAQNPQTSAKYHADCAALVNKRIMDAIPSCKGCNVKIQGQYVKYQGQSYHEECAKKKAGIK